MKTALMGVLFLVATCGANAQEAVGGNNVAAAFDETSAAKVQLVDIRAFAGSAPAASLGEAASFDAEAAPSAAPEPAKPKLLWGERDDYRFQLGVGFEYMHFNSRAFDADLLGINTSLTYYTNSWFGVEGDVPVGFSTGTYFNGAHAKIVGGLGGVHLGGRRAKWEPWAHGLVGGSHLQPQTAGGGRTSFMTIVGGGVDYRLQARVSVRFEGDWVYTRYFSETQNNFQGVVALVLHF